MERFAKIDYDNLNNPVRIQFTNGNVTKYVYSAAGEKLRVIYQTAVPNITVAIGSTRELTPSETLYTDSIDYLLGGALTLRNGRIDKFLFDEGYCQAERDVYNPGHDNFTFCYYDKDHLGNVRQVTALDGSSGGNVIQRNNYYPFGAEFCDNTASNSVQSRKYNGKEFDSMHGLNTYDYGARQYNPVTARWDRVDPLAEKYPNVSPYAYCGNNPIMRIDPDGRDWYEHINDNGQKSAFWEDNNASSITIGEYTYENVGSSYTINYGWGSISYDQQSAQEINYADGYVDPNSSNVITEALGTINNAFGGSAGVKQLGDKVTLGDNGKFYGINKGAFNGNQYVSVVKVAPIAERMSKGNTVISLYMAYDETKSAYIQDGRTIGGNTKNALGKNMFSWGGAEAGGYLGAQFGTYCCPGWGTVIGGAAGAILGGFGGEQLWKNIYNHK